MTTLECPTDLYKEAMSHLNGRAEAVGFFIADFHEATRTFLLRDWKPVRDDGYEHQGQYHVRLSDATQTEMIQWATAEAACLVEAHSHGRLTPSAFSSTDLDGLSEWVPHCSWRLSRRPYAAIVTADDGFDALAWIDGPHAVEQVATLAVGGLDLVATGITLEGRRRRE